MSRFYFKLWFFWALRVTLCSVSLALLFSSLITLFFYIKEGYPALTPAVVDALWKLESFWFMILWNLTLLIALFRSIKHIFNHCYNGYKFELLTCPIEGNIEVIEEIGYGDLIKVWRKWFMLLIWLVGAMMVIALTLTYLFTQYTTLFAWFNIYILFGFVLVSGYFSFVFMSNRCKKIRLSRC